MEWLTLIINAVVTLISVGGIAWIFTIRQDRKAKDLENQEKENDIKEKQKDEVIKDWKDIAEERKTRCDELKNDVKEKESLLHEKDATISELRQKLDDRNTYCGVSELLRCSRVQCADRIPPFASTIIATDRAIQDFIDKTKEGTIE